MTIVVFVPGNGGCELHDTALAEGDGERIWPPHLISSPYRTSVPIEWLARKTLRTGSVIDTIDGCVRVYDPINDILEAAGFVDIAKAKGAHRQLSFAYDWRGDIWRTAQNLADALDAVSYENDEEIILLAHSLGGLVCRLVLESGTFAARPWFKRLHRFYALSTPHFGSLDGLAKHLGLRPTSGVEGDVRAFMDDPDFASGYQLLPSPVCFGPSNPARKPLIVNRNGDSVSMHSKAGAELLGLNLHSLALANDTWARLDIAKRPAHVKYRLYNGAHMQTIQQIQQTRSGWDIVWGDAGDGAVPEWSLCPSGVLDVRSFRGQHLEFLRRSDLAYILGEHLAPNEGFAAAAARIKRTRIEIQTNAHSYYAGQPIRVSVFIHGEGPWGETAVINLERVAIAPAGANTSAFDHQPLTTLQTAIDDDMRLTLPAPGPVGAYRLSLRIKGQVVAVSSAFVVADRGGEKGADA